MPPGISSRPLASMTRPAFSAGSCAAMALMRSPEMPKSARKVSVAVTTVAFRMMVSKRMGIPSGRELYTTRSRVILRHSRADVSRSMKNADHFQRLGSGIVHDKIVRIRRYQPETHWMRGQVLTDRTGERRVREEFAGIIDCLLDAVCSLGSSCAM